MAVGLVELRKHEELPVQENPSNLSAFHRAGRYDRWPFVGPSSGTVTCQSHIAWRQSASEEGTRRGAHVDQRITHACWLFYPLQRVQAYRARALLPPQVHMASARPRGGYDFLAAAEVLQDVLLPHLGAVSLARLSTCCKGLRSLILRTPPGLWKVCGRYEVSRCCAGLACDGAVQ